MVERLDVLVGTPMDWKPPGVLFGQVKLPFSHMVLLETLESCGKTLQTDGVSWFIIIFSVELVVFGQVSLIFRHTR
jgi:hypothetical protein